MLCLTLPQMAMFLSMIGVPYTSEPPFLTVHSQVPAFYVYREIITITPWGEVKSQQLCTGGRRM